MADNNCNDCLPQSVIIQSDVMLEDIGELSGTGCLMILVNDPNCGPNGTASPVNPNSLSMTYNQDEIDEVLNDWDASCAVTASAIAALSQRPRVDQIKIGYYDPADVSTLSALAECNKCSAFVTPELRDSPFQLDIAAWAEANRCKYGADVCDPLHKQADTNTIGAQLTAAGYEFTEWFYHDDCDTQKASAVLSNSLGHSFANGENYSQFTQEYVGVPPISITVTELENLTGFSSSTGLDTNAVNHGNVCACINGCGGARLFWGLTASGDFFDNRHYTCDLEDRINAEMCNALDSGILATVGGYQILANSIRNLLRTDQLAGLIAGDIGNEDSQGEGYTVSIPTPAQAGQALRSNRIAPCVQWQARRDQPVHVACNNGLITQ